MGDVLGPLEQRHRLLRGLVAVERALVVLTARLVELGDEQVVVEPLQLLAEAGDVLVDHLPHGGELGLPAVLELAGAGGAGLPLEEPHRGADDQQDEQDVHAASLRQPAERTAGLMRCPNHSPVILDQLHGIQHHPLLCR